MLNRVHQVPNPVTRKWAGTLPATFCLRWNTIWLKERIRKEGGLLWQIWHKAVAVNHWRGRIDDAVDKRCPVCPRNTEETILHRFWECEAAKQAWNWAIHIMNILIHGGEAAGPWCPLTWQQGIFSVAIPRKFNPVKRIWIELRTVVLWTLWTQRNDAVFNQQSWPTRKLLQQVWNGMIDYGHAEWAHIIKPNKRSQESQRKLRDSFWKRRCRFGIFAQLDAGQPKWVTTAPFDGFLFQPP